MDLSEQSQYLPKISIIIPARDEEIDIASTIEACINIEYPDKEIIVVDDSTDRTTEIVKGYQSIGVQLLHRDVNNNGCCGARNLGMSVARGDIYVLMNADDRPNPDFLYLLLNHYLSGADYVVVKSVIKNIDNLWGYYLSLIQTTISDPDPEWSEGFSCRRSAAQKVGYIPGDYPIPFCRDYLFGVALKQAGFIKVVDHSIHMQHIAPNTFNNFWKNQRWRGTFSAPHAYYIRKLPIPIIILREVFKMIRVIVFYLLIFPCLLRAYRIVKRTNTSPDKFPPILFVGFIQDLALVVGNFQGLNRLLSMILRFRSK
jgi:glycosyltransferase involved in cell wall biosynthesis